jgi:hypothetical protein
MEFMEYCQVKTTIQSVDMIRLYSESLHAQAKNWLKGKISCKTLFRRTKVLPQNMKVGSIRLTSPAGGFSPAKNSDLDTLLTLFCWSKALMLTVKNVSIQPGSFHLLGIAPET